MARLLTALLLLAAFAVLLGRTGFSASVSDDDNDGKLSPKQLRRLNKPFRTPTRMMDAIPFVFPGHHFEHWWKPLFSPRPRPLAFQTKFGFLTKGKFGRLISNNRLGFMKAQLFESEPLTDLDDVHFRFAFIENLPEEKMEELERLVSKKLKEEKERPTKPRTDGDDHDDGEQDEPSSSSSSSSSSLVELGKRPAEETRIKFTLYSKTKQYPDNKKEERKVLHSVELKMGEEPHEFHATGIRGLVLGVEVEILGERRSTGLFALRAMRPAMYEAEKAHGTAAGHYVMPVVEADKSAAEGLGSVCGFADLHLHLMAELGFGGGHFRASIRDGDKVEPEFVAKVKAAQKQPQQATLKWLKQAHDDGLNMAVISAVSNEQGPVCRPTKRYSCEDMPSALRQLRAVRELVENTEVGTWAEIVTDPYQARRAVHQGKLGMILGVEVSNLMPGNANSWRDQLNELYDMGVRSIILAHKWDSEFAGTAYFGPGTVSKKGPKMAGFPEAQGPDGLNSRALTEKGVELLREMWRMRMVIDVAHLARHARKQVDELLQQFARESEFTCPIGVINSHARFYEALVLEQQEFLREFQVMPDEMALYRERRSMVGLRNGPEVTLSYAEQQARAQGYSDTPGPVEHRLRNALTRPGEKELPNDCDGSTTSVMQLAQYSDLHGVALALGSDLNGHAAQNGPRKGKNACANPPKSFKLAPGRKVALDLQSDEKKLAKRRQKAQAEIQRVRNRWVGSIYDTVGLAHVGLEGDLFRDMYALAGEKARPIVQNFGSSSERLLRIWERMYGDDSHRDTPVLRVGSAGVSAGSGSTMKCADYTKMHDREAQARWDATADDDATRAKGAGVGAAVEEVAEESPEELLDAETRAESGGKATVELPEPVAHAEVEADAELAGVKGVDVNNEVEPNVEPFAE